MNKKIGIVITDGVGYRNFVLSNFLKEASNTFSKVLVYSGLPIHFFLEISKDNIEFIELPVYKETRKVWFFRKLKELAHSYQFKSFYGINDNLKNGYPKKNTKRGLIVKLTYLIARVFHSEKNIYFFEKLQFKLFSNSKEYKQYQQILENNNPDILFFTHQRPPFLAPFLAVAQKLKIKTSSFIFSWDNLASKGRMLGEFDSYFVWSDLMKNELLHFYPNTNDKKVAVVGTPQFEPYVMNEYTLDKTKFLEKFRLDKEKKIICYSCADASIGANDEIHIRSVYNYIKNNLGKELQLLVRTSPAEDGSRFYQLKKDIPEIIWNIPKWIQTRKNHAEIWSQRLPTKEDIIALKAILMYSDVNINMLSTMSLDFMLFDKPVVNTVFGNAKNGLYNDQRFLNYAHYKYVVKSKAVTIAKSENKLHNQITEALEKPNLRKHYRKNLIHLEIGKPLKGTSKRIVEELKSL